MPRQSEYKPLLYTTTVRNPERYKDFIHLLKKFDGQILTADIVEQFEREAFKCGLYRPVKRIPESAKQKWGNTSPGDFGEYALTDEETKAIFDGNDPRIHRDIAGHKEAGFERGWESRFETQFKLLKVLGFVYYNMGERIEFSETGNFLADTVSITYDDNGTVNREIVKPQNEQIAFMQAFAKQQRCNPFIRELNDNIPLILLLQVIRLLNSIIIAVFHTKRYHCSSFGRITMLMLCIKELNNCEKSMDILQHQRLSKIFVLMKFLVDLKRLSKNPLCLNTLTTLFAKCE